MGLFDIFKKKKNEDLSKSTWTGPCADCDGAGRVYCDVCDGEGGDTSEVCTACNGDGGMDCPECEGSGEATYHMGKKYNLL